MDPRWRVFLVWLHYKLGGSPSKHFLRTCWCQRGLKSAAELMAEGFRRGFNNREK